MSAGPPTAGAAAPSASSTPGRRFSFARLGPFYRLQRRLGLLSDTDLAAGRRALLFVALAWLPALLLALVGGVAIDANHERALLLDFTPYAVAIAIGCFVLMEASSERRLARLVGQFEAIVEAGFAARFAHVPAAMQRRTGSALVEGITLVAAYAMSWLWLQRGIENSVAGTWFGHRVDGVPILTLAGWWALLVALPLYWFLLGRWLWRFFTWGWMLFELARTDLRLVPTHPDRCGGIAFIGQYPKTYTLFVFAMSTVVSAAVLKLIVHGDASLMSFKFALIGMVVFMVAVFVLPLAAFAPRLAALKRQGLRDYSSLLSRHNLAFEARWLRGVPPADGAELLGSPDASSLADIAASYELVKKMLPVPVTLESVLPLVFAALVPIVCVAATRIPLAEIVKVAKGLLLL